MTYKNPIYEISIARCGARLKRQHLKEMRNQQSLFAIERSKQSKANQNEIINFPMTLLRFSKFNLYSFLIFKIHFSSLHRSLFRRKYCFISILQFRKFSESFSGNKVLDERKKREVFV